MRQLGAEVEVRLYGGCISPNINAFQAFSPRGRGSPPSTLCSWQWREMRGKGTKHFTLFLKELYIILMMLEMGYNCGVLEIMASDGQFSTL